MDKEAKSATSIPQTALRQEQEKETESLINPQAVRSPKCYHVLQIRRFVFTLTSNLNPNPKKIVYAYPNQPPQRQPVPFDRRASNGPLTKRPSR
jgi:hypothetical protein